MRRDNLSLADIVEAADDIAEFVAGLTSQAFLDNGITRWSAATCETPLLRGQVSGILGDLADPDSS